MPQIITTPNLPPNEGGNIKLLSTEVQEIISQKPSWIVRNGIVLFSVIIVKLLAITFFISYPDVINANAKFTSVNAPKEVKAKVEGKLVHLSLIEGKIVNQNDVIGFLESRAVHSEVIELSSIIDNLQNSIDKNEFNSLNNFYKNLGEVQQPFQIFVQALSNYKQYLNSGYYKQKENMLQQDLSFLQRMHGNLEEQKKCNKMTLDW